MVVVAVASEEPGLALHDRASAVHVEVVLLGDGVSGGETTRGRPVPVRVGPSTRLELVGDVVSDGIVVLIVVVHARRELVAPGFHREVQKRAGTGLLAHVAGAADRELLEAPEVEVAGVRVLPFGDVDALEERLVLPLETVCLEAGLRPGV